MLVLIFLTKGVYLPMHLFQRTVFKAWVIISWVLWKAKLFQYVFLVAGCADMSLRSSSLNTLEPLPEMDEAG